MNNPTPSISNPLTVGYIHPNSVMFHYMKTHIIFPRKRNFGLITQVDVKVIWVIENEIKVNWEDQVIKYMTRNKKNEVFLGYISLVTKIMEKPNSISEKKIT